MATLARTSLLGLLFAACLHAAPASAIERAVTYVSTKGADSHVDCNEKTPCRTFTGAQFKTRNGGIIICQDSGDFSDGNEGFFIAKSITIDCTGHTARIDSIFMHARPCLGCAVDGPVPFPDGPKFIVILRGLTVYGGFSTFKSVHFTVGLALHIENCTITGFANSPELAAGIHFAPTGKSRLHVTNSVISGNGNAFGPAANAGGGIVVSPTGSGAARVILTRGQVHQNTFGIVADSTASTAGISMTISDSVSGGNLQDGILAISKAGQGPIRLTLERTRVLNNDANGIRSSGPDVVVRVDDSVITGNARALAFDAGGTLLSAGNNLVEGNANNSPFSGVVKLK